MTRILYLSYTGLTEPLGRSQIIPYLRRLPEEDDVELVTFEKPDGSEDTERIDVLRAELDDTGVVWTPLPYHHRPRIPATAWDLSRAAWTSLREVDEPIDVVHVRGHQLAPVGALVSRWTGAAFLFDVRGFWVDAKADADQVERGSVTYRLGKSIEARLVEAADGIVVLTHAAREALDDAFGIDSSAKPVEVVPTCVDLGRFAPSDGDDDGPFTLGYVGSASGRYEFDATLRCFGHLLEIEPDSELSILNKGDHAYIRERIAASPVDPDRIELKAVPHEQVPEEMQRMDAGVFFYPDTFSSKATSPTKLGEFLASGVPCLTRTGVGDVDGILEGNDVGVVVDELEASRERSAVKRLVQLARDPETTTRCRRVAEETFSVDEGAGRYARLYDQLTRELEDPGR